MTSRISIEPASPSDLQSILRLAEAFYAEAGYPFDAAGFRRALKGLLSEPGRGFAWLMTEDAEPVGYVVLTFGYSLEYLGRDGFVDELYVRPEHRRRGAAHRAFEVVERAARRFDVKALHLEVEADNEAGRELYRKMGFEQKDRSLMTKRLDL